MSYMGDTSPNPALAEENWEEGWGVGPCSYINNLRGRRPSMIMNEQRVLFHCLMILRM